MGMPAQMRSSDFQPGLISHWDVFINGDVVSFPFKRFSAGGLRLIPGISIIQDIVGVLIIFRIDFLKQLYNLNKFQKMSPMGASD